MVVSPGESSQFPSEGKKRLKRLLHTHLCLNLGNQLVSVSVDRILGIVQLPAFAVPLGLDRFEFLLGGQPPPSSSGIRRAWSFRYPQQAPKICHPHHGVSVPNRPTAEKYPHPTTPYSRGVCGSAKLDRQFGAGAVFILVFGGCWHGASPTSVDRPESTTAIGQTLSNPTPKHVDFGRKSLKNRQKSGTIIWRAA